MVTVLKLISVVGMSQANRFLNYSLSTRASDKVLKWALLETLDALSPSTLDEASREAGNITASVGVPPAAELRKRLPPRAQEFEDRGGLQTTTGLERTEILDNATRNLQEEGFQTQTLSHSAFTKPGALRFLDLMRSEGGYTSKDGNYSYHIVSFRLYGRMEDEAYYMIEGVGHRRDAF